MQTEYRASPIAAQEGNKRFIQADSLGNTKVTMGAVTPDIDLELGARTVITKPRASGYISTATTTTIDTGAGFIDEIFVVGGTLGNVTIYDNTAASGTILLPAVTPVAGGFLIKNCPYATGVTIVTAAATVLRWNIL